MSIDEAKSTVVNGLTVGPPIVFGMIVNVSAGTLMTIGGALAWFIVTLVTRLSLARAKTRREWVLAENLSLEPSLTIAKADIEDGKEERKDLRARIDAMEDDAREKDKVIRDASIANRELAFALLEASGVLTRKRIDE